MGWVGHGYTVETTYHQFACNDCGGVTGIPHALSEAWMRTSGKLIHCAHCGHKWHCGKTEVDKAKERAEFWEKRARDEESRRAQAERQRAAARGQVTKIRKRIGRGACPCCNRFFANVSRHMAAKHPDYSQQPGGQP